MKHLKNILICFVLMTSSYHSISQEYSQIKEIIADPILQKHYNNNLVLDFEFIESGYKEYKSEMSLLIPNYDKTVYKLNLFSTILKIQAGDVKLFEKCYNVVAPKSYVVKDFVYKYYAPISYSEMELLCDTLLSSFTQDELASILSTNSLVLKRIAIKKIDPIKYNDLLNDIVNSDEDWISQGEALKKMGFFQKYWALVALNGEQFDRIDAIEKLDYERWQDLLAGIVKNDDDDFIKGYAIKRLDSIQWQDLLVSIAMKGQYNRKEAIEKLDPAKNQSLLNEIASDKEIFASTRISAILKIEDTAKRNDLLVDIIKSKEPINSIIRSIAIENLDSTKYQDLLVEIIKDEYGDNPKLAAIKKLVPEQYQNLLSEIATDYYFGTKCRIVAINMLNVSKWQELFLNIARDDSNRPFDKEVRIYAIQKIENKRYLKRIIKENEPDNYFEADIYSTATKRLEELKK